MPRCGRYVSVALSVGLPLPGVTRRPALWSSDFPHPRFRSGRDRLSTLRHRQSNTKRGICQTEAPRASPSGRPSRRVPQRPERRPCLRFTRPTAPPAPARLRLSAVQTGGLGEHAAHQHRAPCPCDTLWIRAGCWSGARPRRRRSGRRVAMVSAVAGRLRARPRPCRPGKGGRHRARGDARPVEAAVGDAALPRRRPAWAAPGRGGEPGGHRPTVLPSPGQRNGAAGSRSRASGPPRTCRGR